MVDLNLPVPGVTYGTEENPVHGEMINAQLEAFATALGATFADVQIDGTDLVLTREGGDVVTLPLPEASPAAIEAAVTDYLTANPPSGATDGDVADLLATGPLTGAALTAQIEVVALRHVYLSHYGVVGDATDARVQAGTATDNTAAIRSAINDCLDASGNVIGILLWDVRGWTLIREWIDTRGVSVIGLGRMWGGPRIDPTSPRSAWQIGGQVNNMLSFGTVNGRDYFMRSLGFHGSDAYAPTFAAWGGSRVGFEDLYVTNSGKCGVQLIGSRREGIDDAIVDSHIKNCLVEKSKWSYVVDGEAYGVQWADLVSRDAVVRAFSLDPLEAESTTKRRQRGFSGANLSSYGRRVAPADWSTHPTPPAADAILRAKRGVSGVLTGLQGRDFYGAYGLNLDTVALEISAMQLQVSTDLTPGTVALEMGTLGGGNGCHISGMVSNYTKGLRGESLTANTFIDLITNQVTTPVEVADLGFGSIVNVRESSSTRPGRIVTSTPADTLPRTVFEPATADTGVSPANNNNAYFFPVIGSRDAIARLHFEVTNQAGNIELAIYTNAGEGRSARPSAKVATTGVVACPGVGMQSLALDKAVSLDGARHWIGLWFSDSTSALLGVAGTESTRPGTGPWAGRSGKLTGQSGGLPATIAALSLSTTRRFLITGGLA